MPIVGQPVAGTPLLTTLSDATAEQWHIKSGKTAYIVGGKVTGNAYTPAMMQFDGTTGYYSNTAYTSAGNAFTAVCSFKIPTFSGGGLQRPITVRGLNGTTVNLLAYVHANDHATVANRGKMVVATTNAASTVIMGLLSNVVVTDNARHTLFISYNGATGTATFRIDGNDADDTGYASRVLTTGTINVGANGGVYVGRGDTGDYVNGDLGFVGYREAYLTNWSDFMQTDGSPKELDESTWTEWGAQPSFWNKHGQLDNNLGSEGNMTRNGTIIVGDGGN